LTHRALIPALMLLAGAAQARPVEQWLTTADRAQAMQRQPALAFKAARPALPTIEIDAGKAFQPIDGFGFAVTGGSAQLIMKMSPAARGALLQEIFGRGPGRLGVHAIRISIGSSDLDDHVFTYDDMPAGREDPELARFSIDEDRKALIPLLREILAIDPGIHILASPWSAPGWMKTNGLPKAGGLKPEAYDAYARYLVRYLQAMKAAGVPIEAVTLQNEPQNPKNTPSMVMTAEEQARLIGDHVGPAFRAAGLPTRIIAFDHNCDDPGYAMTVLGDAKAGAFTYGSGFHLYEGDASAMSGVHDAHPDKHLYLTEQMVIDDLEAGKPSPIAEPASRVVIGAMRNWAESVLLWNLAADPGFGPHTSDGGCTVCQGAVTIDGDKVSRNAAYYAVAQASSFVTPGSRRIASTVPDPELPNVAWRTPEGRIVLLVANRGRTARSFAILDRGRSVSATLSPGSASTFIW
jgi:glucosylceramidase